MLARIALKALRRWVADRRAPDIVIGGADNPYIRRWYVWPRNRVCNLYLHQILRDDDDRALHDHPWINASWILSGGYFEVLPLDFNLRRWRARGETCMPGKKVWRKPGSLLIRRADQPHRLMLERAQGPLTGIVHARPAWSLFLTGPNQRSWGFHCAKGWVHWRDFTAGPRGETIGAGCDQPDDKLVQPSWSGSSPFDPLDAPDGLAGGIGHRNADNDNLPDRSRRSGAA